MLTVVCGEPGSGKTTFCNSNKSPAAMLIDLDAIAAALNPNWKHYSNRSDQLAAILQQVRGVLVRSKWPEIWLICTSKNTAMEYARQGNGTCILCRYPEPPMQLR
jgi:predicted ABC-type ATPase